MSHQLLPQALKNDLFGLSSATTQGTLAVPCSLWAYQKFFYAETGPFALPQPFATQFHLNGILRACAIYDAEGRDHRHPCTYKGDIAHSSLDGAYASSAIDPCTYKGLMQSGSEHFRVSASEPCTYKVFVSSCRLIESRWSVGNGPCTYKGSTDIAYTGVRRSDGGLGPCTYKGGTTSNLFHSRSGTDSSFTHARSIANDYVRVSLEGADLDPCTYKGEDPHSVLLSRCSTDVFRTYNWRDSKTLPSERQLTVDADPCTYKGVMSRTQGRLYVAPFDQTTFESRLRDKDIASEESDPLFQAHIGAVRLLFVEFHCSRVDANQPLACIGRLIDFACTDGLGADPCTYKGALLARPYLTFGNPTGPCTYKGGALARPCLTPSYLTYPCTYKGGSV